MVGEGTYLKGHDPDGPYLTFGEAAGAAMMKDFKINPNSSKRITFTVTCGEKQNCVLEPINGF